MSLKENFQYVLDNYLDGSTKVDNTTKVYSALCRDIPRELKALLDRDDFAIKGSMGAGNKTDYPWVSILNKNITTTTQKGLYVVFLFKSDMSGFYLSLNQGITNFDNLFKSKKYVNAEKVADYYRTQLDNTSFSLMPIKLGPGRGGLGHGYEVANIVSKFYPSNNFSTVMLEDDLDEIIKIYDMIFKHMESRSYDSVIQDVLADEQNATLPGDIAIERIKEIVDPDDRQIIGLIRQMQEVPPYSERSTKFKRMTAPKSGKIDYLKKARTDAENGLLGEELAIQYEQERLENLGREDLAAKVNWVAKQSDEYGYDIQSFELDANGKEYPIYIEVKTTDRQVDTEFFVSKHEVDVSKKLGNSYCVFRIYNVKSINPKFYRVFGKIEENFILDPVTFMARYKYGVKEEEKNKKAVIYDIKTEFDTDVKAAQKMDGWKK